MAAIRVLVVDDSAFMRRAIQQMLADDPQIEIVGTGRNGVEAVDLAKRLKPDVITLDIEMPEMDGLTALRRIMREAPTQVLMCSSLTTEGSRASLRAMCLGAADVIAKDQSQFSLGVNKLKPRLTSLVKTLGRSPRPSSTTSPAHAASEKPPAFRPGTFDAVCIGSSTGGSPVVETILAAMPANLHTPFIIAQHMPRIFTQSMAERLDQLCPLTVVHVEDGMTVEPGHVYLAPGGAHLHIRRQGLTRRALHVSDEPTDHIYKPSVDVLFSTAAETFGKRTLGIVLTGIGDDGLRGARQLHDRGATLLAQSQETCVVYGMPKAVTEAALVQASLCPAGIVRSLLSLAGPAQQAA